MAAHSAFLKGASEVFVVDQEPTGCRSPTRSVPRPSTSQADPVEQILDATNWLRRRPR